MLIGGFGPAGQPVELIDALIRSGVKDLTVVNNNAGNGRVGLAALLASGRSARSSARSRGKSIPTSSTSSIERARWSSSWCRRATWPSGCGPPALASGHSSVPPASGRPHRGQGASHIDGRDYVLEYPIKGDVALIKAFRADTLGNLVYRKTARNFGPVMATAAKITVVQVSEIVQPGGIDPEVVITPESSSTASSRSPASVRWRRRERPDEYATVIRPYPPARSR